jgi:diguanylate cyclase (GGDEF)-like protein
VCGAGDERNRIAGFGPRSPPAMPHARPHRRCLLLQCLAALLVLLAMAPAVATPPTGLVLRDSLREIDAWPGVRVLKDDTGRMDARQALAALDRFQAPASPHANLGPQRGAVWLALPLHVPAGQGGRWLLEIDYPGLQRIDVIHVHAGQMGPPATMGSATLRAHWPLPARAPVLPLALQPGHDHLVLMRVASAGGLVLPIRLLQPVAYQVGEERAQALQGLITGLELFLLLYSLTQWVVLRDPMYLDYVVANVGLMLVFLSFFGLGPQHLWPHSLWLSLNAAPAAVFLGLVGVFRFVERWLSGVGAHRRLLAVLRLGAVASAVCLAAFVAGLLDYRQAQLLASLLGPVPMLSVLPVAWRRARAGDPQAVYMFLGWSCYAVGAVTLTALVRGLVPANEWTQHAFQVSSLAEMTLFMVVLGLRVKDMRAQAAQARHENAALQALAHTDPLTGLLNRRGLGMALDAALRSTRPERPTAVLLLDLDGFKDINDRLGHDAGDALLVAVAARLKAQLRAGDAVARLGGDEFVVVLPLRPGSDEAGRLGRKLQECIAAPLAVSGHDCRVGVTIGHAVAPFDGVDAASLLRHADAAMYAGKQAGRHRPGRHPDPRPSIAPPLRHPQ